MLHPRAGSPAEQLGWGARLYAFATLRGLNPKLFDVFDQNHKKAKVYRSPYPH
jgi:hypothetical protein